jgi:hypothetical protein
MMGEAMSNAARTTLLLIAVGTFIVFIVWVLFLPALQAMQTGSEVRVFDTFDPIPITYSDQAMEAPSSSGDIADRTPNHIEIAGEEPDPTFTPEFEAAPPAARPLTSVICRTGPTTCEPALAYLMPGQPLPVDGKTADSSWLSLVLIPTDLTCWVRADLLLVTGYLGLVPELDPDVLPCATPPPTEATTGCWVKDTQHPNGFCRPGACTPNDVPGTSCTPP